MYHVPTPLHSVTSAKVGGLSFQSMFETMPTDPASLVAIAIGLGFVGAVLYFGTRKGTPTPSQTEHPVVDEEPDARDTSRDPDSRD